MNFCLALLPLITPSALLVVFALLITKKQRGISLLVEVENASLSDIPITKRGGGYLIWIQKNSFVSRDVKFFEDLFPFDDSDPSNFVPASIGPMNDVVDADFAEYVAENNVPQQAIDVEVHEDVGAEEGLGVDDAQHTATMCEHPTQQQQAAGTHGQAVKPAINPLQISADSRGGVEATVTQQINEQQSQEQLGRGMRQKIPSVKLRDYVTHTIFTNSPSPSPNTSSPRHSSGTPYPIAHYINCDNFSANYRKFLAAIISGQEPRSFKEAMKHAGWRESMKNEIHALEKNGT